MLQGKDDIIRAVYGVQGIVGSKSTIGIIGIKYTPTCMALIFIGVFFGNP